MIESSIRVSLKVGSRNYPICKRNPVALCDVYVCVRVIHFIARAYFRLFPAIVRLYSHCATHIRFRILR